MSGKERRRKKSDGWVSHAPDKHLLKASIVARLCCLIIIRATSGLHIATDVTLTTCKKQEKKVFSQFFKIILDIFLISSAYNKI
jgi:hypothetical protein